MFNPLEIWRGNGKREQEMKARIVRNREGFYQTLNEWTKTAKGCPLLLISKCKGPHCSLFMKFENTDLKTGNKSSFHNCAIRQMVLLQIETNQRLLELIGLLKKEAVDVK